ncbi:LysE family transporter [Metabacillus rhizolycopersici]|uniref:LysE family translocator n=1 Tax=Metabacillus rhizolycopersici TaxID=2875709 RepID=A0ABS7UYU7_9BACI|nr:LysE family transporter [Metabacillus rhizolycopersici]MBZ5753311.1 LysE family translocator [Metabacillus rhizolycopersici]
MSIFISYLFLGISLAAPIGPINTAQIDKGIKGGFFHAWLVGLGAMVADAVYMILVYLGVVHFLETPFMKTFLYFFGFFVLVYTGIESIIGAGKIAASQRQRNESLLKSFLSGFFMSLSSPLTILFWIGIYGSVLVNTVASSGMNQLVLYSGTILLGVLLWDVTMACVASGFRKYLTEKILVWISIFSGLSLIGFGIYFGINAIQILLS